mgnify:FL=1
MNYCQSDSCVIFRRVYRINNVRNEITISWSGGFATLCLHTRIRAKRETRSVRRLTTNREFALYIARKICRLQVSSLHFYDIISDNLDEFAASYELAAAGC